MPLLPEPPYDRAVALACSLRTVRARWLYVRCRCGRGTPYPIRLLLREHPAWAAVSLADVLVRLRCGGCGERRHRGVWLCERGNGLAAVGTMEAGWRLLLHEAAG